MLNTLSVIFTLVGLFTGVDRYCLRLPQMAAFELALYIPTAFSLLGMLLGFCGVPVKNKKKRRYAFRCAVFGLAVCLALTALWLYQVLSGETLFFGLPAAIGRMSA